MVRTAGEQEQFITETARAKGVEPGFTREFADIIREARGEVSPDRGGRGVDVPRIVGSAGFLKRERLRIQEQLKLKKEAETRTFAEKRRQEQIRRGTIVGQLERRKPGEEVLPPTPEPTPKERVGLRDVLFGRAGEQFVGISGGFGLPGVTFREIKEAGRKVPGPFGFPIRVVSELIPTTLVGVAATAAFPVAIGRVAAIAPTITRVGLGTGGVIQAKEAFEPGLTVEERAAAGLGAGLLAAGAVAIPTRFRLGVKAQKAQVKALTQEGLVPKETAQQLLQGVKLQKFLRRQPDVPVTEPVTAAIPKGLTQAEREVFGRVVLGEDVTIFGGQALALRGVKATKDIDIIVKDPAKVLTETQKLFEIVSTKRVTRGRARAGGSIGLGGEKAFDVKGLEIAKEFPFTQPRVRTAEGVDIIRLSEQFSRTLSGALELRKGGEGPKFQKDISSSIIAGRGFIKKGLEDLPTFPGLRQIKQVRLRKAEKRLAEFEKALPELSKLAEEFGGGKALPLVERRGLTVPKIEAPPLFPVGKKAQVGLDITKPPKDLGLDIPRVGKPPRVPKAPPKRPRPSEIKPSELRPSVLPPPLVPSRIKAPRERPDEIIPSIIKPPREGRPSVIPPFDFEPSGFRAPELEPPGIPIPKVIEGFVPIEPRVKKPKPVKKRRRVAERKPIKKKEKKRKKAPSRVAPSFTAVVTEAVGEFPEVTKEVGIIPTKLRLIPPKLAKRLGIKKRKK